MPQKINLDPDVPVRARDFVALGLDAHRFGFARRTKEQRELVEQMLRDVDAERFADTRVGSLSGGEQQRILIAHALISQPSLLLARRAARQPRPEERARGRGAVAPRGERPRRRGTCSRRTR